MISDPVVDGELGVEPHQPFEHVVAAGGHDLASTVEQVLADVDQHLAEQRLLATEVVVQRRAADAGGVADVVDRDVGEAVGGEQLGGDRQQLLTALAHWCTNVP